MSIDITIPEWINQNEQDIDFELVEILSFHLQGLDFMNKIAFSILLSLVAFLPEGRSQTLSAWIKAADESYLREDYYSAFKYFEIALE